MERAIRICDECGGRTSLYRVERDLDKKKKYICSKHPKKEKVAAVKKKSDDLEKWFRYIHEKYKGICQETGRSLTFSKRHCAHLLNKADYPYFRLDPRNGILVDWKTHHIIDFGSPTQRKALNVWEEISKTRKLLLEEVGMEYDEQHWLNMNT